jgi:hypothetical protein
MNNVKIWLPGNMSSGAVVWLREMLIESDFAVIYDSGSTAAGFRFQTGGARRFWFANLVLPR